ncbi:MAG: SCO family protein [Weeksellaceae bacterium]|nr:SCO family protein [Weeksellaceae bacterium]
MIRNFIILLCILFSFVSCNQKEKQEDTSHSASIFQLNSDWENQNGEHLKLAELKGKTLIVAMIYTSCKTACPRLTAEMNQIENQLGEYDPSKVRFVLVSIDPEVDTPEKMSDYLKTNKFDGEQWVFLRGSDAGTREFANVLSVKYKQIDPVDFSHSNIISVFSEKGVLSFQKEGLNPDVTDIVNEVNKLL